MFYSHSIRLCFDVHSDLPFGILLGITSHHCSVRGWWRPFGLANDSGWCTLQVTCDVPVYCVLCQILSVSCVLYGVRSECVKSANVLCVCALCLFGMKSNKPHLAGVEEQHNILTFCLVGSSRINQ